MEKYDFIVYAEGGFNKEVGKGAFAHITLDAKSGSIVNTESKLVMDMSDVEAHIVAITSAVTHLPDSCTVLIYSDATIAVDALRGKEVTRVRKRYIEMFNKKVEVKDIKYTLEWHGLSLDDPLTRLCWQGCSDEVGEDFGDYYDRNGKFGFKKAK